jgi:hypothetical protein
MKTNNANIEKNSLDYKNIKKSIQLTGAIALFIGLSGIFVVLAYQSLDLEYLILTIVTSLLFIIPGLLIIKYPLKSKKLLIFVFVLFILIIIGDFNNKYFIFAGIFVLLNIHVYLNIKMLSRFNAANRNKEILQNSNNVNHQSKNHRKLNIGIIITLVLIFFIACGYIIYKIESASEFDYHNVSLTDENVDIKEDLSNFEIDSSDVFLNFPEDPSDEFVLDFIFLDMTKDKDLNNKAEEFNLNLNKIGPIVVESIDLYKDKDYLLDLINNTKEAQELTRSSFEYIIDYNVKYKEKIKGLFAKYGRLDYYINEYESFLDDSLMTKDYYELLDLSDEMCTLNKYILLFLLEYNDQIIVGNDAIMFNDSDLLRKYNTLLGLYKNAKNKYIEKLKWVVKGSQ